MKKIAYILIGVPGSGKSTRAQELMRDALAVPGASAVIHSTDQYFMVEGEYKFDPNKLGGYHMRNLDAFKASLDEGITCVICDNTNVRARDRRPYKDAARGRGYEVQEVVVGTFDEEHYRIYAKRNSHGVPLDVIQKMGERYLSSLTTRVA